jgi:hypothetical protein
MDSVRVQTGHQATMIACDYCHALFKQGKPLQRFCKPACRAAHNRDVGIVASSVSARKLKTRNSITLHTTDDRVLTAPLGTKWQLVKVP